MNHPKSFKNNRKYKIWMYTVSHSTLIIRSEKQYSDVYYNFKYDDPNTTIDIIFTSVDFMSIPQKFDEINIEKKSNRFIINNNENWFVEAANCNIGKYDGDDEDEIWNRKLNYNEIIEL